MLTIDNLTLRIAGRTLLEDASLAIDAGQRVGVVGRNGTGKTTLFRLIRGEIQADSGSVRLARGTRVGGVAQEAPDGPQSLIETVLAADTERTDLLARADTETDGNAIAEIHTRLADIDAHEAPARAARILAGLGFDDAAQQRPVSDFSGGWRMRVALAAALFAEPDLLLLDEPTNHLDLEAAVWLEQYLAKWPGTLLIISHDRGLLNRAVDTIAHLSGGTLTRYAGNYDRFERLRRERQMTDARLKAKQEAQRAHIQSFIDRFRAKATKARQAQSRIKMLERMEPIAAAVEDPSVTFRLPEPAPLPPPIVTFDRVSAGYVPGSPVLSGVSLRLDMDDRIGVLGANGNGKTTLLRTLAGHIAPEGGSIVRPPKLRVGYFAQHQVEALDADADAITHVLRHTPDMKPSEARARLAPFGLDAARVETLSGQLSGGERARLSLALICLDTPHLLMLDEPTNHLDVDAREALVQALNAYSGAVLLVSHDAHLVELVCDRLWLVEDGRVDPFEGTIEDYKSKLQADRRERRRAAQADDADDAGTGTLSKKDLRKQRAQARAENQALRKRAAEAEKTVEKRAAALAAVEGRLSDPKIYEGSTAKLMEIQLEHAAAKERLAEAEMAWLEAQENLEAAQ